MGVEGGKLLVVGAGERWLKDRR